MPTVFGTPTPVPGPVRISNVTLRNLIAAAYGINPNLVSHLLSGGSVRLLERRFDIEARPPEEAPASETPAMLRTLLADRFKLRVHTEQREIPVDALTRARPGEFGRALRQSEIDCNVPGARQTAAATSSGTGRRGCRMNIYEFNKPGQGDITMSDTTPMKSLIARIQPFVDRPLVDATGLVGSFEWSLSFATRVDSTSAPIIYTALQEQLGLRAEQRTAPFEVLVIDSAEMPTPN